MSSVELLIVQREAEQAVREELQSSGRNARASTLFEQKREGVLGVIFIDDDAIGDYPIVYRFVDGAVCPLLTTYEEPNQAPEPMPLKRHGSS